MSFSQAWPLRVLEDDDVVVEEVLGRGGAVAEAAAEQRPACLPSPQIA